MGEAKHKHHIKEKERGALLLLPDDRWVSRPERAREAHAFRGHNARNVFPLLFTRLNGEI